MDAVRIGMVGLGHISTRAHLPPLKEMADRGELVLQAFCDVNEETVREQGNAFGVERVYTDHHAMFEAEELDAVYLCIPPTLHDDVETICATRGIAIFVEKPQTLDMAQARRFSDAIGGSGIVSQVGFMSRYYPSAEAMKARLAERTARHAQLQRFYSGKPIRLWTSRYDLCGGSFVENTIHYVDLLRYFLGDIESVSAFYVDRKPGEGIPPMDMPHVYNVNYRFKSGATANATTSRVLTNVDASRSEFLVVSDDSMMIWSADGVTENGEAVEGIEKANAFGLQAEAFVAAVRAGEPSMTRSAYPDALNSLSAVLGANVSAERGGELVALSDLEVG